MSDQFEEWFHRKTQEVLSVKVGDADGQPNEILFTLCSVCGQWYEVFREDLQRDYVRNEPVTLQLLEQLGWEITVYGGGLTRGARDLQEGLDIRIYFDCGKPKDCVSVAGGNGGEEIDLLFPATYRDLMHMLRIFGAECSVTPAPT